MAVNRKKSKTAKKKPASKAMAKRSAPSLPKIKTDRRVFVLNPQVFYRYSGPLALTVIDLSEASHIFEITGVAVEIFCSIDGERTVSDMMRHLYGSPRPRGFEAVVKKFLTDLNKMKLISKQ